MTLNTNKIYGETNISKFSLIVAIKWTLKRLSVWHSLTFDILSSNDVNSPRSCSHEAKHQWRHWCGNVWLVCFISDPVISLTNKSDLFHFSALYVCTVCCKWIQAHCYLIFLFQLNYDFSWLFPFNCEITWITLGVLIMREVEFKLVWKSSHRKCIVILNHSKLKIRHNRTHILGMLIIRLEKRLADSGQPNPVHFLDKHC